MTSIQGNKNGSEQQNIALNVFQILTIEDDKVFDLKFTRYTKPKAKYPEAPKLSTVDSSIRLRIGRVQAIMLYRFISEASVSVQQCSCRQFSDPLCAVSLEFKACIALFRVGDFDLFCCLSQSFLEPFINPDIYNSYKVAAQTVVHDTVSLCVCVCVCVCVCYWKETLAVCG